MTKTPNPGWPVFSNLFLFALLGALIGVALSLKKVVWLESELSLARREIAAMERIESARVGCQMALLEARRLSDECSRRHVRWLSPPDARIVMEKNAKTAVGGPEEE